MVTSGEAAPNDTQDSEGIIGAIILWISGVSGADLTQGHKLSGGTAGRRDGGMVEW